MKLSLSSTTMDEFADRIIGLGKQDNFAKTFLAKCKMLDKWDDVLVVRGKASGIIVGAILVTTSPQISNLQLLHTFADFRRNGIATVLCKASLKKILTSKYFRLSAEPDAVPFYQSLGIRFRAKQKSGCWLSLAKVSGTDYRDFQYFLVDEYLEKKLRIDGRKGSPVEYIKEEQ